MAQQTFEDARKTLVDLLTNLSFVKVVSVQKGPTGIYTGEASNLFKKELVFFDKFGRSRTHLTVGPITLVQAALGFDHPSSIPSVGEILVGTSVPNTRKSHLSGVLRGWSSDAKPLCELLRILQYGTKKSEFDNRSLLLQQAAIVGGLRTYRDEIYMLARLVLWKNVRPLQVLYSVQDPSVSLQVPATEIELLATKSTFISVPARTFVEIVSVKLSCPDILDQFLEGLKLPEVPPPAPLAPNPYCAHVFRQNGSKNICTLCSLECFRPVSPEMSPRPVREETYAPPEAPPEAAEEAQAYSPTKEYTAGYNPTSPTYSLESFE